LRPRHVQDEVLQVNATCTCNWPRYAHDSMPRSASLDVEGLYNNSIPFSGLAQNNCPSAAFPLPRTMAPIITQPRSTENTAAPSYTRRALTSQNDVPLAIGLTVSLVCFVVILGAVWCLWRRKRRLRATHAEFGSAAIDGSSTPVEICSDATETVYKYESDSPSYYPSLELAPLQELDTGRPGNDITPFVESSSVSNSLLRYTSPNGESPSTSEQTSRFRKDYDFTEPDRRSEWKTHMNLYIEVAINWIDRPPIQHWLRLSEHWK